jgi:hypothetical protein
MHWFGHGQQESSLANMDMDMWIWDLWKQPTCQTHEQWLEQ